ncbi:MAG: hypothetical protein KY468_19400 [Armatimonadetes bacterium]|nr:hypothetical protein [Armatimonadota bacterium]
MTESNKYNPVPHRISVRCPDCRAESAFEFEQGVYPASADAYAPSTDSVDSFSERDLQEYRVSDNKVLPRDHFRRKGNITCSECGKVGRHHLIWPDDAFYQCDVRGHTLWAWTRRHVTVLKAYIESREREVDAHLPYGFSNFILHVPKFFLLAKNRELAVKKLSNLLLKGIK